MDDPDMILSIHADANCHTENPVIRQRLRPQRVDLEPRRLNSGRCLNHGPLFHDGGANKQRSKKRAVTSNLDTRLHGVVI
jgi:hypothetical protein